MRPFAAIFCLLAGTVAAQDPLLHDERVWVGFVEVHSKSHAPADGRGHEVQAERLEIRLGTIPPSKSVGWARVAMRMREGKGTWALEVDTFDGSVTRKGAGAGRLHALVEATIEPASGRYEIHIRATPARLVAKTTMTGTFRGNFTVWRTIVERQPILGRFKAVGVANKDRTLIEGERKYVDRGATHKRDVTVKWRFKRVDPVVKGRVVDHLGRPAAGLTVLARYQNAARLKQRLPPLLRRGETDADGRFAIPAHWGHWRLEVLGRYADGALTEGRIVPAGADLTREGVPDLSVRVDVYDLAKLPRPLLYLKSFQRDAVRYFEHLRRHYPKARLEAALLVPPAEG